MATLAGQRAAFTWALRQYNLAEEPEKQAHYARLMAKYIATAPANGFTEEQLTQGQLYPEAEVSRCLADKTVVDAAPELSEGQALQEIAEAVDISDVARLGDGSTVVYAYGYRCAPDRLKIGMTIGETVQRIAAQIGTGTPDKPVLVLEIKTHDCRSLEKAVHAILEHRGLKVQGAGQEWFKTSREEIVAIYRSIVERSGKISN